MNANTKLFLAFMSIVVWQGASAEIEVDEPIECKYCDEWNQARKPFQVFGNTYYVGTRGLSSILIASNDGLILIDGALPQSAPLIAENIRSLGYEVDDIKLILNSHAHYDHAGGIAAMARASEAVIAASSSSASALMSGAPTSDDPQFRPGTAADRFPAVAAVQVIEAGETLRVGDVEVTAHFTPGHTPGSTSWTWQSCVDAKCLNIAYADSLTAVSADGFRFTGDQNSESVVDEFRESIEVVKALPCDILLAPHPGAFGLDGKLRSRRDGSIPEALVDPQACRQYAENAQERLDKRVTDEE